MKKIIDIEFGSSRYEELVNMRYKVLMQPLGLKFLDMHRELEANYLHVGMIEDLDDCLIGGVMLAPSGNESIRMLQVAVDNKYQGEGLGKKIISFAENKARDAGYKHIFMNAMLSVVDFYEKLGYKKDGDVFEDKGITFLKMSKDL
ncbi:MAG: GNAT family N-acetyltransferase [Alphaproteobacteria bacterium]